MPDASDDPDGAAFGLDPGDGPAAEADGEPAVLPGGEPAVEADTVILGTAPTRASRRAARRAEAAADVRASESTPVPVVTTVVTIALALLIAVSGFSGQLTTGVALVFCGVVLSWGWTTLLGSPSPRWSGVVVGVGAVSVPATAGLTADAEQLRWLPVAIGVTLILGFLQQLLRTDRTRLTEGLAGTIAGLAVATAGAPAAVVPVYRDGADFLLAAMVALVVGALVEQLGRLGSGHRWVLAPVLLAGGLAAYGVAFIVGGSLSALAAVLIGVLVAGVSHVLRRVMAVQPTAAAVPSAAANGAASVLVVGVLVYLLTRVFVG